MKSQNPSPSRTRISALAISLFVGAIGSAFLSAKPEDASVMELGAPFADHAVLQRKMPLPVWGWSEPGTKVTVEFAGQTKSATAGENGKWLLSLNPLEASAEGREMKITGSDGRQRALKDLLVGEVWMASGQSNMQWIAAKSSCELIVKELQAKGEAPPIREFEVKSVYAALHPVERATGTWKNGDYGNYSAVAFAFAHRLYQELKVPIGILNCSFSQTTIESWVPRGGFAGGRDEYTRGIHQRILETDPTTPEHQAAWEKFYQTLETTLRENAVRVGKGEPAVAVPKGTPGNLLSNRDPSWMFNGRLSPVVPYAISGCIWNQGYANMADGIRYYDNLHSLIRGWRECWNRPELPVYFHQFYCPGQKGGWTNTHPDIGSTAEMRLGTWLARDIPHTGMASQIDIEGAIHYRHKAVPGQRLALHALKNQYGRKLVTDGPMFRSYAVEGDQLVVTFDHAEGGLAVAETGSNALGKPADGATGFANPKAIPNGDDQVKHFYLAGEDRVWHPAVMKIEGERVFVSSPMVKAPRGVSYGTGGVGFRPGLYNNALLPMTPFISYDNQLVTSKTWPDVPLKIAGVKPDPNAVGKLNDYRKMPLLSSQFCDSAVLQAGQPLTIWGSAVHEWEDYVETGKAVIRFSFAGIEKTIPVTPGMREWQVVVPAMAANAEPKTLKVTCEIDGTMVHERIVKNIVIGDVWYVAAPANLPKLEPAAKSSAPVRMMIRKAKGSSSVRPRRFSVSVSTTPDNRFSSLWEDAEGFAAALGHQLGGRSGNPVGIIFMQSAKEKGSPDAELKEWFSASSLKDAPSLMDDYQQLAVLHPGNSYHDANVRRYIGEWKKLWDTTVPEMMRSKRPKDGEPWGTYPTLTSAITTKAGQIHNCMVVSFTPGSFKGILFLCGEDMFLKDQGARYGEQLAALANGWKKDFGAGDPHFFYTIPSKALAAKITAPLKIEGASTAAEIGDWKDPAGYKAIIETMTQHPALK